MLNVLAFVLALRPWEYSGFEQFRRDESPAPSVQQ